MTWQIAELKQMLDTRGEYTHVYIAKTAIHSHAIPARDAISRYFLEFLFRCACSGEISEGCLSKAAFLFCLRPAGQFDIFSLSLVRFQTSSRSRDFKSWCGSLSTYCVVSRVHTFLAVRAATAAFISILTIFPLLSWLCVSRALLESQKAWKSIFVWLSRRNYIHTDDDEEKMVDFFEKFVRFFAHTRHSFAGVAHRHRPCTHTPQLTA